MIRLCRHSKSCNLKVAFRCKVMAIVLSGDGEGLAVFQRELRLYPVAPVSPPAILAGAIASKDHLVGGYRRASTPH
jgi:hypothetical protein